MKTRLSTALIACFLVISLGPLAIVAALSYSQAQSRLSREITSQLRINADNRARQLESYVRDQKKLVTALAYSPTLKATMGTLEQIFKSRGLDAPEYAEIDRKIRPFLSFRKKEMEFHDLLLLSLDGQVIFSLDREKDLGTNLRSGSNEDSPLARAFNKASMSLTTEISDYVFYPPSGKVAAFIAAPLEGEGTVIGVLAAQLDIDRIFAIAGDYEGLGQTGEFVVGRRIGDEAVFLAPTRHDSQAAFQRRNRLTDSSRQPLAAAVQGVNGEGVAQDYLGHDVWAVWRYLPGLNWGMVVKMDMDEAFAPLAMMRETALLIACFATSLVLIAAVGVARWIVVPIVALKDSTRQLAVGNYSHRARESRIAEVTDLARAFNTMAGQIEERTSELARSVQHTEDRFRNAFDHAPIGMALVSPEGRLLQVNHAFSEITGYTEQELLERTFQDITHPDDLEADFGFVQRMLAGDLTSYCMEKRYIRKDGHTVWILLSVSRSHNEMGKPFQFLSQIQDISERKRHEEELIKAKAAAEAASRAKSEFLANMSHEIRTPMNGILGMTELALETPLSPRQREFLTMAKSSADSLVDIINDILDFSKIEAGKLEVHPEPFPLRECLEGTLRTLALRAHAKGLELACKIASDIPEEVVGDSGRLRQVLVNLVGNAIKFTERGEIVVASELESAGPDEVVIRFTVSDTGIGIPKEKLRTIFDPFEQADSSTTRRFGGTGLGLTISAQLVQLLGGKIWLESEVGRGSIFSFTMRLGRHDETSPDQTRKAARIQGVHVLIVDDNQTNRRILEEVLANWGATSVSASGGPAALAAIRQSEASHKPFHLALLDGMMPEMDGFELAERIRRESHGPALAIIMLTSGCRTDESERCRSLGISAFLLKPVSQSELFNALVKTLEPALEPRTNGSVSPRSENPSTTRRLRVLLAEDNIVNQKVATRMLENLGHQATVVGDGVHALAALEGRTFDVVLMDIQMPEMDGFEAVATLRERERQRGGHTRVIALTAHALKGDRERCLAAGFDDYLGKPLRAAELNQALDNLPEEPARRQNDWPISLERLLKTCDGDLEFMREMIGSYLETSPGLLFRIDAALAAGDLNRLSAEAHGWKGICQTIGLEDFAALCRQLEDAGRQGDLAQSHAVTASIHTAWERVRFTLEDYLKGRA